jgi:phenylalanyl-tRNA synthetase beta chain
VRVPLSWLRDFAPFEGEPAVLAATLDDLGLVVEEVEVVGEGLADVVIARVDRISPIVGADRIRLAVVDAGNGPIEVVCGASNFEVADLVALAPVGAVLPGGFVIGRRKMKGVVSNGMLCSGRELRLSDDHEGILVLNDIDGAAVGVPLSSALGIEPDVVFDVAVEANRPDAWCIAGVARDLAARLGIPFAIPETPASAAAGPAVNTLTSVRVDDLELCPRFTARVITGVQVNGSPNWMARRLILAGMRPINNVVDASNYVMLELGQPTHPYDLDRLPGSGLVVRRAQAGERVTTLDGVERTLGRPGPGLGDTGQDCLICDAEGAPVAIGGLMGGSSTEIGQTTTRVLLEAAYFVPMAIARTSKRLTLRTEASARFERGCDPAGIDRAAERFSQLLALTAGPAFSVATGVIDVTGDVPRPVELAVRPSRINALLGTGFTADEVTDLLAPLGIGAQRADEARDDRLAVVVPTFRPDIRPAPMGEADIAEEVARTYGYARLPRHTPSWPQPGRLTRYQRERRLVKDVLCGLGATEAWTAAFVTESDQLNSGVSPPYIEVTNPLVDAERYLRSSMVPGMVRAVVYNAERRQGDLRLFEVGSVFHAAGDRPADPQDGPQEYASERLSALFAWDGDDAWAAVAAWRIVADALGIAQWVLDDHPRPVPASRILHAYRSATVMSVATTLEDEHRPVERVTEVGVVGELDPTVVGRFGLLGADGRPRRVGWLDLDLGVLLDVDRVARRSEEAQPISRYPSSDVDLAFVVKDVIRAGSVERTLRRAGGDLVDSLELFDVYRGPSMEDGTRSLAFRLRFCAVDRTLTDEEVGTLRTACIVAVEEAHGAALR